MNLPNKSEAAYRVFHMAHKFLNEFGIHWLPVDPYEIINKQKSRWKLKYVDQVAYEIGKPEQYVLDHVMRSQDGIAMFDPATNQYDIILNNSDSIPQTRMLWTTVHEIGHIYLGHLGNERTKITSDMLSREEYEQLEFEADNFAGEVLASKWLMRQIDIIDENDIALICGISDDAALSRYKKATEDYNYVPVNVILTLHNFEEYLKSVTVCRTIDEFGGFAHYTYKNHETQKLPKPKPLFLRRPGTCPYCGQEKWLSLESNFCIACGSALKPGLQRSISCCNHINHSNAAFCEQCGNRVYRIKQGLAFEECEIL
ncbi:MAG: ImmA/IrrE family metallo-endopeptidase [Clostridia bacterium]|nr:ImmA/IrrE family metallo-endopeptidase [Clostridia bacterium]